MLLVTLGTGVGGGIVTGGRVLRGAHGFGGGDRPLPGRSRRPAVRLRRARTLGGGRVGHRARRARARARGRGRARRRCSRAPAAIVGAIVEGIHVGDAAAEGDADAVALRRASTRSDVALGLVGLVNILDPELVVVSGGLVELGDVLLDPLRDAFDGHIGGRRYRPAVPIVAAELGDQAGRRRRGGAGAGRCA